MKKFFKIILKPVIVGLGFITSLLFITSSTLRFEEKEDPEKKEK